MAGSSEMRKNSIGSKKDKEGKGSLKGIVAKKKGQRSMKSKAPSSNRNRGNKSIEKTCKTTEDEPVKEKDKDKKNKSSDETKDAKGLKDPKNIKDPRENKDSKEVKEQKVVGKDHKGTGKDSKNNKDPKLSKPGYKKTRKSKEYTDESKTDGTHCTCASSTSCSCGSQAISDASVGKLKKGGNEFAKSPPLPLADDDMAPTEYESVEGNSRPFISSVPKRKISFIVSEEAEFQKQLQEAYDNEKTANDASEIEPSPISCYFNVFPAYRN